MFTGLIEKIANVENIINSISGAKISFFADFDDVKKGDSIAINGTCLTIVNIEDKLLTADIMRETLNHTNLKYLKKGDKINLERALKLNSRLAGHIVTGHVDILAILKEVKADGFSYKMKFECNSDLIVKKGSITINGISLTVSDVFDFGFEVSIIPATMENTNIKYLKVDDKVNIEYDILAKYIKKFSSFKCSNITEEFLKENGF